MLKFPVKPDMKNTQLYKVTVIENQAYNAVLNSLIDSGASTATWVSGLDFFYKMFPGAVLQPDLKAIIRGFGGEGEVVPVYILPEFILMDERSEMIRYRNLPIAVTKRAFDFHMIISYPMVNKMNVEHVAYENRDGKIIPVVPELRFYPVKETYYARYSASPIQNLPQNIQDKIGAPQYITNTVVFTHE